MPWSDEIRLANAQGDDVFDTLDQLKEIANAGSRNFFHVRGHELFRLEGLRHSISDLGFTAYASVVQANGVPRWSNKRTLAEPTGETPAVLMLRLCRSCGASQAWIRRGRPGE